MPPKSWFRPKLTRGWRSAPVKSVLSEQANRQSQREGSSVVVKVLYIEDNDDDVYMLKMRLELLGNFEVLTAADGEKGCEVAAAEQASPIEKSSRCSWQRISPVSLSLMTTRTTDTRCN